MRKGARGILIKAVVVIIIASVVGYWSFVLYNQKKEQNLVLEMCNNVKKTVPNGITKDKYYPDEQYIKDITCVSLCNLKLNTDGDCYEWTDGFHFTFNMEDNFDQLSQSEQYEIIKRLGLSAPITYSNEINEQYPKYYEYQKKYKHSDQLFGKLLVTVGGNEQVVFQTSTNTYEYAQHVDDYYLKNGEEIYLQDEYNNKIAFTNGFGTPTTKCAHTGCNEFIAPSCNTNCCIIHSNKCLECGNYCDEDALYCLDCIQKASSLLGK